MCRPIAFIQAETTGFIFATAILTPETFSH
jgi:hypothetical protein